MCDFCGCPEVDPFSFLTDEHVTLARLAESFERGGDLDDLDTLAITWDDHRAHERAALEDLAAGLAMGEELELVRPSDEAAETLLAQALPDAKTLRFAIVDHADRYEFEVFPHLVLAADDRELAEAAERAAAVRASAAQVA
ncbi:MAG: hypothetical protein ACM3WR_12635 [Solirubrobacterales bacterium]